MSTGSEGRYENVRYLITGSPDEGPAGSRGSYGSGSRGKKTDAHKAYTKRMRKNAQLAKEFNNLKSYKA